MVINAFAEEIHVSNEVSNTIDAPRSYQSIHIWPATTMATFSHLLFRISSISHINDFLKENPCNNSC